MSANRIQEDLDYVASALRRRDDFAGVPAIHFLWAAIVLVGYALPDFAPRATGWFWLVAGIGGGVLSRWLGIRSARRAGVRDVALGRRYSLHWIVAGIGFLLCALPMLLGRVAPDIGVWNFMLVAGLANALAGVHLVRPQLWAGLLMLAAYAVMVIVSPPYAWTISGVVIALALVLAGLNARGRQATQ